MGADAARVGYMLMMSHGVCVCVWGCVCGGWGVGVCVWGCVCACVHTARPSVPVPSRSLRTAFAAFAVFCGRQSYLAVWTHRAPVMPARSGPTVFLLVVTVKVSTGETPQRDRGTRRAGGGLYPASKASFLGS